MKPTYSNDKKAPRMRKGKFSKSIITRQLWKEFREKHPEHDITWKEFSDRWKEMAETIRYESIYNPLGVKLGYYTGELKLQYLPYKLQAYNEDEKVKEEIGGKTTFPAIETKGKTGKIKWERRWAVKFNRMLQFFAFEPTREMNTLAKERIDKTPESLRMARNTLGGYSIWRTIADKHNYRKNDSKRST